MKRQRIKKIRIGIGIGIDLFIYCLRKGGLRSSKKAHLLTWQKREREREKPEAKRGASEMVGVFHWKDGRRKRTQKE